MQAVQRKLIGLVSISLALLLGAQSALAHEKKYSPLKGKGPVVKYIIVDTDGDYHFNLKRGHRDLHRDRHRDGHGDGHKRHHRKGYKLYGRTDLRRRPVIYKRHIIHHRPLYRDYDRNGVSIRLFKSF